ncbi:MAG: DUF4358 domain-containing protein [Clostridium sp.]
MKKIVLTLLTTMMIGATVIGCSQKETTGTDKNVSTSDIVTNITEKVETRPMGPIEDELAKEKFHLVLDDVEEYSIQNGMMNTGLETVAIVKAKEGKVDSVKASLEKAKEDKKRDAFYPGEAEAVDAAEVKVIGNYVALIIIPEGEDGQKGAEKAMEEFENSLK